MAVSPALVRADGRIVWLELVAGMVCPRVSFVGGAPAPPTAIRYFYGQPATCSDCLPTGSNENNRFNLWVRWTGILLWAGKVGRGWVL